MAFGHVHSPLSGSVAVAVTAHASDGWIRAAAEIAAFDAETDTGSGLSVRGRIRGLFQRRHRTEPRRLRARECPQQTNVVREPCTCAVQNSRVSRGPSAVRKGLLRN